jgi:hypothetical protein
VSLAKLSTKEPSLGELSLGDLSTDELSLRSLSTTKEPSLGELSLGDLSTEAPSLVGQSEKFTERLESFVGSHAQDDPGDFIWPDLRLNQSKTRFRQKVSPSSDPMHPTTLN